MVLQYASIEGLVKLKPKTKVELLGVKVLGNKKINDYGAELIELIRQHCGEQGPPTPEPALPAAKSKAGTGWKASDRDMLCDMHSRGQSVKAMAAQLGRSSYAVELKLGELGLGLPPVDEERKRKYQVAGPSTPVKKARY